jgi:N-acetyl-anhydromuramyl-L-alanine amidase AmpD
MFTVTQRPVAPGNWRKGKGPPRAVRAVVLHVTEGTAASVRSWFANPAAEVSAHFMVTRAGAVEQFVSVHDVAYHAGRTERPTWRGIHLSDGGQSDTNATTVGIEHEGNGTDAWPAAQLLASCALSAWLVARFGPVTGLAPTPDFFPLHREIYAPKSCPGAWFDRARYLAALSAVLSLTAHDPRALVQGIR